MRWEFIESALTRIEESLKSLSDLSRSNIQCIIERVNEIWADARTEFNDILKQEGLAELNPPFESVEARVMNIKGQCLSALDTPTERLHYNNTSLPHIKLPVFSGLYDEFPKFHDIVPLCELHYYYYYYS